MADAVIEPKVSDVAAQDAKAQVRALLDRLPEGLSLEQIQYHLDVYVLITRREERADEKGWVPHEEAKKRIASWFDK